MQLKKMIVPMLAVVALTGAGANAAAATKAKDPNAAVVQQSTQDAKDVQAYWTPERMRSAVPMPVPAASASALSSVPAQTHKLPAMSAPGFGKAATSGFGADSVQDVTQSGVWTAHGQMPASTVGKLYFTTPKGNSECTASVIASNNHSMIWTAGHCASDGAGHWYTNFQFVPDYHDGVWPYGSWVWKSASTPTAYLNGRNFDYDVAAITLWPSNGRKVADVVGWQGYKFNWGYNWFAYEFGYPYDTHPARAGINGQQLRYCAAGTWQAGGQQAIHCDQGHGASGGPWLDDLQFARGWGYLVGNVSYHPYEWSDEERSPHFGDAAVNVYNAQTNV
ncbi:trypsin-like serine peptidase [Amycolatopsis sp. NPDC059657]|uniref:trypsin-like serine peptidase n=1 Tax=Amycolatopsis sp. NPDC059657 TaxID=3346899 RepID=UPI00366B1F42